MTPSSRRLCIGFCLAATWRHSQETVSSGFDLASQAALARRAEAAKLDFLFQPDTLQLMRGSNGEYRAGGGVDPTLLMTALAQSTHSIGLVTTASTTFNPPYVVARQLQSLHWLSHGRAGWNIVTSIDGAENFGSNPMPDAEARYSKAREFTELVRALWKSHRLEGDNGVAPVNHKGEYFQVFGPLNVAMPPAGPPPLFQAGASEAGREFAATTADAIFAATPDREAGRELCADLRVRAVRAGRDARAVKVLPGLHFFLGETRDEALDSHRRAHAHLTRDQRHDALHKIIGADLRQCSLQQRLSLDDLPSMKHPVRSRTHADLLRTYVARERPTLAELLERPEVVGSAHWVAVGTVEEVVEDVLAWFENDAMDGFIALPGGNERSVELFFDSMVPMLVDRGVFREDYRGTTLREHLEDAAGAVRVRH